MRRLQGGGRRNASLRERRGNLRGGWHWKELQAAFGMALALPWAFAQAAEALPVERPFRLAQVPLQGVAGAPPNVLAIMDDSGSMAWSLMTPSHEGEFLIDNFDVRAAGVAAAAQAFRHLHPLPNNAYGGPRHVPTMEALAADADFQGNSYGVWRARSASYNRLYYDPNIRYRPWAGLNAQGQPFADAPWPLVPLNPFAASAGTIDLSARHSWPSEAVPVVRGAHPEGRKLVLNEEIYIPYYYFSKAPAGVAPGPREAGAKVVIDGRFPVVLADGAQLSFYPGGPQRTDCPEGAPGDGWRECSFAQERRNFANWFVYHRSREYAAKAALGQAVAAAGRLRLGYAPLNDAAGRLPLDALNASYREGHRKALLDRIYAAASAGGTPLRSALDRAGRHFECLAGDAFGSTAPSRPGEAGCPVPAAPKGACQASYALLISDGAWNGALAGAADANHDADGDGDPSPSAFDGGMFADAAAGSLADVAMHYYERDLHPELADELPATGRDRQWAPAEALPRQRMHQHMKTYTLGFGTHGASSFADLPAGDGNPNTSYRTPFAWSDPYGQGPAKIDDLLHAAVNGRGEFLPAKNPAALLHALQEALQAFSQGAASVAAAAFNSTALKGNLIEYRAFFDLSRSSGDLHALPVDPASGLANPARPLWRAAQRLSRQLPSRRILITYDAQAGQGIPFAHAALNADQQAALSPEQAAWLRGVRAEEHPGGLMRERGREGLLGSIVHSAPRFVGPPQAIGRDRAPFPLAAGDAYAEFARARRDRRPLVYVGANDGMLHGFDAETGDERFAYIPNALIDASARHAAKLSQLTERFRTHQLFVDLTPTVEDAFVRESRSASRKSWQTILIGGLGGGGKGYFALNVTDPEAAFASPASAARAVLWEFADAQDSYPTDAAGDPLTDADGQPLLDAFGHPAKDLGYAFSEARIAMSNAQDSQGAKEWAAIFGNGYNSASGIAKLFVLFIDRGMDGWSAGDFVKLSTGQGAPAAPDPLAGRPNGLGEPALIDADLNGTADRAYAGDLLGNLYRFDLADADPENWSATRLFRATYGATPQPIARRPFVFKHPNAPGFLVVFGTGGYATEEDAVSAEIQSIYGIWDRDEALPATAREDAKRTRLVQQRLANVFDESASPFERRRILSQAPVNYAPDAGGQAGTYGWHIDLDMPRPERSLQGRPDPDQSGQPPPNPQYPGEKAIRRIAAQGDALLVATVIPRAAGACAQAPPGAILPIDRLTGGSPAKPVLDVNRDRRVNRKDLIGSGAQTGAPGILFAVGDFSGPLADPAVLTGEQGDQLILGGGGERLSLALGGGGDSMRGRLSWRELTEFD